MKKFVIEVENELESEFIQKLAFKAGYRWHYFLLDTTTRETDMRYLQFDESDKGIMSCSGYNDKFGECIEFYAIAKIKELFSPKPEYRVGDWVKIDYSIEPEYTNMNVKPDVAKIEEVYRKETNPPGNRGVSFVGYKHTDLILNLCNIERHATPDEIKKAKGDDIMVAGHKVEFHGDCIKIGCDDGIFPNEVVTHICKTAKFIKNRGKRTGIIITFDGAIKHKGGGCDFETLEKIYHKIITANSKFINNDSKLTE